jgi:hypothetical protein
LGATNMALLVLCKNIKVKGESLFIAKYATMKLKYTLTSIGAIVAIANKRGTILNQK